MKLTASLLLTFLINGQILQAQNKPVTIPGSQVQTLASKIVPGQEYELQIMMPAGYGKGAKKYPVIYLMDSQWDFPLVTALYGQQYYDGFVPETIIVGVTWTGKYNKADSLRVRDYVPTNNKSLPQSGGANQFLSFLQQELIPYVESQYNADKTNRTLMGCSFGGLFTLYALFAQPGLFQSYVAATPAIGWDDESIYRFEKAYFEKGPQPPAKLYLCVGGVERGVPAYKKLVTYLSNRRYKNLQIQSQVLKGIGHSGTKGIGYERGLQFVFERPSIKLTAAQQKNLSGTYKSANGQEAVIKTRGDQIILQFGEKDQYPLLAASEAELYSTAEFLNLRFNKIGKESSAGFVLERYGSNQTYTKTN